ncbi:MAG: basic secretory protein-like protein [Janthinobacterium lividum]
MNRVYFHCRIPALIALALCLLPSSSFSQTPNPSPVEALIYSTMPSTAAHRPEMAMDGDPATYFKAGGGMDDGDDFLVLLSSPITVQFIQVVTGDNDQQDTLTEGNLETSPDAVNYVVAGKFNSDGVATATGRRTVRSFRIHLGENQNVPALLVREITVTSAVKIAHVMLGPGRGFVDISQASDLAVWSAKAEKQMEESWADTSALLYSNKFITPNMVNVVYRTGPNVTGVAATGGGVMTVNSAWCRAHPEDTGLTVHETAHVIQAYQAYDPVWMVEGIADYIRWIRFEPENYTARINVNAATYHDSYRTTATFLGWCEIHYDSRLVTKLSEAVRFGTYQNSMFKTYCGKDVDTLWAEFIADYKADPASIITPPIAAADRPRLLPTAAAGSGVPVDLTSSFNTVGITADGAQFPADGGMDAGGTGYSSKLLGLSQTWQGVPFQLGPAGGPDAVTCRGETVPLPAGSYSGLWLLGTAINGSQMGQMLTVTYTDGTTDTLAQSFSDWFHPDSHPGESRAVKMTYRNIATGEKDARTFYAYSYGFALKSGKTVKSLALPNNDSIKLLAVTLTK